MATPVEDPADARDMQARTRVAAAVRRVGHAIVGHDVAPEVLDDLAVELEGRLPSLERGATRSRLVELMKRIAFLAEPADGERLGTFPDCVVSGDTNPLGIGVPFFRRGDDAVAFVRLGAAFEGAPDRAHGGVVAAIFDDLMGFVLQILGQPAYTAELTVRYHAPTPVRDDIEFVARLRERDGRKLWIDAEALHGDRRVASAEGLFIAIDRARFTGG